MDTSSFAFTMAWAKPIYEGCCGLMLPTNYYLPPLAPPLAAQAGPSENHLSLSHCIIFPLVLRSRDRHDGEEEGLWWWQSVRQGWIPPLNNYYLPVGRESFITVWLYNCAQNTAPPTSTPNMQSSLRSLKYGPSIWRWHLTNNTRPHSHKYSYI